MSFSHKIIRKLLANTIKVFLVLFVMTFFLYGCSDSSFNKCPAKQPCTQWLSDDGRIFIDSDSEGNTTGYFEFGNIRIPIDLYFVSSGCINIRTHQIADEFVVNLGDFYRSGSYKSDSFAMSILSWSRIKSTVTAYSDKICFEKLDENEKISFDINEYNDSFVLRNSEIIFKEIDDLYSDFYKYFERTDHSKFDSFIIALDLVKRGCTAAVTNVDAIIDSNLITVTCTDEAGKVYCVKCDYSKHVIVD